MRRGFPSRRDKPLGPEAPASCFAGLVTIRVSHLSRSCTQYRGPKAVVRRLVAKMSRLAMTVHRGPCGANLRNTARGTPGIRQSRGDYACVLLVASYTGLRGCSGPSVPRALVLSKGDGMKVRECGLPGADQTTRAMTRVRCLKNRSKDTRPCCKEAHFSRARALAVARSVRPANGLAASCAGKTGVPSDTRPVAGCHSLKVAPTRSFRPCGAR